MKLFQIEEPDGAPIDPAAPGAAVGMDLDARRVAISVGGNAELLPAADGEAADGADAASLLRLLRGRAEKQLARPVTHAVLAADGDAVALAAAAEAAGLAMLRLLPRAAAAALASAAAAEEAPALGAAVLAEDLAPSAET